MAKARVCSLFVQNLKNDTRVISKSVLGPKKGGMVHFDELKHVRHALNLEEANLIELKTDVPEHVQSQLNNADGSKEFDSRGLNLADNPNAKYFNTAQAASTLSEADAIGAGEDGVTPESATLAPVEEDEKGEEDAEASSEDNAGEADAEASPEDNAGEVDAETSSEDNEDEGEEAPEEEAKPEWYLTYEQVEKMTRTDLLDHFENVEEIDLPKSKNAGETKAIAHEQLAAKFEDHKE